LGQFPRVPLAETLPLLEAIQEMGQGERVRRVNIFIQLNQSPESGASRMLISSANSGYGLIDGGYQATFLELTERGRQMIRPVYDEQKRAAALDALFSNSIFSAFLSRFKGRPLPDDTTAASYLRDMFALSESEIDACIDVFKQNIQDFGLIEQVIGESLVQSRMPSTENYNGTEPSTALATTMPMSSANGATATMTATVPIVATNGTKPHVLQTNHYEPPPALQPTINMNLQINLPENGSPDVYESIFKNIAAYLLGRPRNVIDS